MNRTEALIRGLQILSRYAGENTAIMDFVLLAGPRDHRIIGDEDAKELDSLGWHVTIFGWAFEV